MRSTTCPGLVRQLNFCNLIDVRPRRAHRATASTSAQADAHFSRGFTASAQHPCVSWLLNNLSPGDRAFGHRRVIALIGIAPIPDRRCRCARIRRVIIAVVIARNKEPSRALPRVVQRRHRDLSRGQYPNRRHDHDDANQRPHHASRSNYRHRRASRPRRHASHRCSDFRHRHASHYRFRVHRHDGQRMREEPSKPVR